MGAIIPYDLKWRASTAVTTSIGTDSQFSPFDPSYHPGDWNMPGTRTAETAQFETQFIQQIQAKYDELLHSYDGKMFTDAELIDFKNHLRDYVMMMKTKYAQWVKPTLYAHIYDICLHQYTTEWTMQCGYNGINDPRNTEFFMGTDGYVHLNPFVVYSVFGANRPITQING